MIPCFTKILLIILLNGLLLFSPTLFATEYEATLFWSKRVELSTQVNGIVDKVFSHVGKVVGRGESLIQLDTRLFKATLKKATARYKNANEQLIEARRELERQTDMYDRTMLSEHDLQLAKNDRLSAEAALHVAEADLTQAKLDLEYSAVRAPFNAIIIATKAVKGQTIISSMTAPVLVIIAEAHRMRARSFIRHEFLRNIIIGQKSQVFVDGKSYHGKIISIALEPEAKSKNKYAVDVIFDSGNDILRAGLKVKINL